ncbi:MAG: glycosyltransferase family 4 protein [Dokdonella sp.]
MAIDGTAIFTICSNNYVPMAKVLLESASRHHPEATLYLCLADEPLVDENFYPDGCTVVRGDALDIPDFRDFAFRYDVMEFNTALKPFMFRHVLARGHRGVIYLDPDIEIFSPLKPVLDLIDQGASFVFTPHLTKPAEIDTYPDDLGIMRAGIYNLGFLGVGASEETDRILRWWSRKLRFDCINDQERGIFVDQKFMDLVPGFAEGARVLRNTACNVAYWNLSQRDLSEEGEVWHVDGRPLCFFHFSGIDVRKPTWLSKHTKAFRNADRSPALEHLMQHYVARLLENGHGTIPNATYSYARFASGTPIPASARKMYRDTHLSWSNGDPFETYEEFLHLPCVPAAGTFRFPVTNFMKFLHQSDRNHQANYDFSRLDSAEAYVRGHIGKAKTRTLDRRLIESSVIRSGHDPARYLSKKPPPQRDASEPEIDVIGYLRLALGIGEAGRQMLGAIRHAGIGVRGLPVEFKSHSKATESADDEMMVERSLAPIQLFNINADQLQRTIDHLGDALRPDAYRIAMPFWELEEFPEPWLKALECVDEVWAPTRYIQTMLAPYLKIPVVHMPLPLALAPPCEAARSTFSLPEDAYLFFFAFDFFSFIERKNPLAVARAFRRAVKSVGGAKKMKLVIKTLNADMAPEKNKQLRDALQDDPDIIVVDGALDRVRTLQLINCCDAVVSLHRSEGLGLIIAEAMALGKPVIATDYSATTELLSPQTGWPVDFKLVPVGENEYLFAQDQVWAEVDEGHAAWQMQQVISDSAEASRRSRNARKLLDENFSMDACAGRVRRRLTALRNC